MRCWAGGLAALVAIVLAVGVAATIDVVIVVFPAGGEADLLGVPSVGRGCAPSSTRRSRSSSRRTCAGATSSSSSQERPTPNDHLVELLFLLDSARRASARSITAVLPYFPYGKGDKKDEPRVSVRARVVADALEVSGADRVLTMDLHAGQLQGFFHVPVDNLYALPVLALEIERLVLAGTIARPVIVAPDAGRAKLAREYMLRLASVHAGVAIGDKVRPENDERSEVAALLGDVRDRDCILVDDIIFTGGTLVNMADHLTTMGAKSVRAAVTHGLLAGDAVERIEASPLVQVIVTDTVPPPPRGSERIAQVSVAPFFAEAIRSIFEETSISRLFS